MRNLRVTGNHPRAFLAPSELISRTAPALLGKRITRPVSYLLMILNRDNIRVELQVIAYSNGVIFVGWQSGRPRAGQCARPGPAARGVRQRWRVGCPARRRPRSPLPWKVFLVPGGGVPVRRGPSCSACCANGRPLRHGPPPEKLGALRALIRDDDQPLPGAGYHGDLPNGWSKSLTHEVALALSMPAVSADKLMWTAWSLEAALPGVGALLAWMRAVAEGPRGRAGPGPAVRPGRRRGRGDHSPGPAGQDLWPGREARRAGGGHRRPGIGHPAARGRRAA